MFALSTALVKTTVPDTPLAASLVDEPPSAFTLAPSMSVAIASAMALPVAAEATDLPRRVVISAADWLLARVRL